MSPSDFTGYIVEKIKEDGDIEIRIKARYIQQMLVITSSLIESQWSDALTRVTNRFQQPISCFSPARYECTKELRGKWINIILLPPDFAYIDCLTEVPRRRRLLRPYFFHIGPNWTKTHQRTSRKEVLSLYYVNLDEDRIINFKSRIDIARIDEAIPSSKGPLDFWRSWEDFSISPNDPENNIINKVVVQSELDLADSKIEKIKEAVKTVGDAFALLHLITDTRRFIRVLAKIPGIEILKAGKHQRKATNNINGKSAPIPDHPGDINPNLLKRIVTQQLGIEWVEFLQKANVKIK